MATVPRLPLQVAFTSTGGPPLVLQYPEAANQTFKAGHPVKLDSNGRVTACAVNANGLVTDTQILGIAADNAHNSPTAGAYNVGVYVATDDTFFVANLALDDGTQYPTALNDPPCQLGILIHADSGYAQFTATARAAGKLQNSSNPLVRLIAHDKRDAIGDTGGRVIGIIMNNARQLGV